MINLKSWIKEVCLLSLRSKQYEFTPKTKFVRPYQYDFHYKGVNSDELPNLQ